MESTTHFPFPDNQPVKVKLPETRLEPFSYAHPILDCDTARAHESTILCDQESEWTAMKTAGAAINRAVLQDYRELRSLPERLRILALLGKGNNAGDAMIACAELLAQYPRASIDLLLLEAVEKLKPLPQRALQELAGRVRILPYDPAWDAEQCRAHLSEVSGGRGYHICIDGLLGMSYRPPLRPDYANCIDAINGFPLIDLRAAVDLPSGCTGESGSPVFMADMTYATGIAKSPLFMGPAVHGRVRYLNLGFFNQKTDSFKDVKDYVLLPQLLDSLCTFRSPNVDKRNFGHLYIVGGSSFMPGALLMAVQAALRSGVGLVTAFAPASVAATLAAQVPEAMWVPWPETTSGTLNPKAFPLLTERINRADAVLVGPGMGWNRNTEMLTQQIVSSVDLPVILDADALRSRAVDLARNRKALAGPVILTPHMGEFMRVAKLNKPVIESAKLLEFCRAARVILALKGPITRICDGRHVYMNTFGGPVLSRGGSGDILAGMIGGKIAQNHNDIPFAVARAVVFHGLAAERLARSRGQVSVCTTEVLEHFSEVLRDPVWDHLP